MAKQHISDRSWQLHAACRTHDSELFFSNDPDSILAALAVCESCTVRDACHAAAMAGREHFGVWGATTETERRRVFRRERRGTAA